MKIPTLALSVFISSAVTSLALPTTDELIDILVQDFHSYDSSCRGGSGDQNETWTACGSRDYAATLLAKFGWCHGEQGQYAYEMKWHLCSANSIEARNP